MLILCNNTSILELEQFLKTNVICIAGSQTASLTFDCSHFELTFGELPNRLVFK